MKLLNRFHSHKWSILFTIYLRYLIGATFIYAFAWKTWGMMDGTALQSNSADNPVWASFQCIMNIKYLWFFAAYTQLISGILLVTQRYALIGTILFLPVALCIYLITWSIGFIGTKYIALLLLLASVYLLVWDYKKLLPVFLHKGHMAVNIAETLEQNKYWVKLGFIFTAISVARIWYSNLIFWVVGCIITGLSGLILYKIIGKNILKKK